MERRLKIENMNPKYCTVVMNTCTLVNVYLVDAIDVLEADGVDPFEIHDALEIMYKYNHNTAEFDTNGCFLSSKFEDVKQ